MPALAPLTRTRSTRPPAHDRTARRPRAARRALGILTAAVAASALLSGCAGTVGMEPAADATDPACADVIVRLPDTAADVDRRETDAQGTGAWGDPASVLLRCGVEPSGPTTLPC